MADLSILDLGDGVNRNIKDASARQSIAGLVTDITGKADKVTSATNGNFAGLDANGNLTDSGKKASDFQTVALETFSGDLNTLTAAGFHQYQAAYSSITNKPMGMGYIPSNCYIDVWSDGSGSICQIIKMVGYQSSTYYCDMFKRSSRYDSAASMIRFGNWEKLNVKGMYKLPYTIPSTGWSNAVDSDGYYTNDVFIMEDWDTSYPPNIYFNESVGNTNGEEDAYMMIDKFAFTAANQLTAYATTKPTDTTYIYLEGQM